MATTTNRLMGGTNVSAADLYLKGQKFQNFVLILWNNTGTLEHNIMDLQWSYLSPWADKITGASATSTVTPTVGALVDFAAGVGVGAATSTKDGIFFNTAAQVSPDFMGVATVVYNNTGNTFYCGLQPWGLNINGTTRDWACIQVSTGAAGAASIDTTQIPSGKSLAINVLGYFL